MLKKLNADQRKTLSDFFKDIAVAWFVALFATPTFLPGSFNLLTLFTYSVSMIAALILAILLVKEW